MLPRGFFIFFLLATAAQAQLSSSALRFYGTGVGPPGQQDRVLFPVDDNVPGDDASTPIDVGDGSFTLEIWLRGLLADNPTSSAGGDVEMFDYSWIDANIFLDRDVWCGTERSYGASLAGGLVRFGVSTGDDPPPGWLVTIEGDRQVLDGNWHHVALVRDAAAGQLSIYVDGTLGFASMPGSPGVDLSYPNDGVPVTGDCGSGQLTPYGWYLVLAAEKHDAGASYPSYNGFADELRIWNVARTAGEIAATWNQLIAAGTAGLVGSYRFEEGTGTVVTDSSGSGAPDGDLRTAVAGNGEWVSWADDPGNTAPVQAGAVFADGFESGDTSGWM